MRGKTTDQPSSSTQTKSSNWWLWGLTTFLPLGVYASYRLGYLSSACSWVLTGLGVMEPSMGHGVRNTTAADFKVSAQESGEGAPQSQKRAFVLVTAPPSTQVGSADPATVYCGNNEVLHFWSASAGGGDRDIFALRADSDGGRRVDTFAALGDPSSMSDGDDRLPAAASDRQGSVVVVWSSTIQNFNTTLNLGVDSDLLSAYTTDCGDSWFGPYVVNSNAVNDTGEDRDPKIATDGTKWMVTWCTSEPTIGTGGQRKVVRATSMNYGVSWSDLQLIYPSAASNPNNDWSPDIATDGVNRWMIVFDTENDLGGMIGNDYDIVRCVSNNGGETFSEPIPVNDINDSSFAYDLDPSIHTDQGTWVIAWHTGFNGGLLAPPVNISYARSIDNGDTFSEGVLLPSPSYTIDNNERSAKVISDGHGNWVIGFRSRNPDILVEGTTKGTDADVVFSTSDNNAATFSLPEPIDPVEAVNMVDPVNDESLSLGYTGKRGQFVILIKESGHDGINQRIIAVTGSCPSLASPTIVHNDQRINKGQCIPWTRDDFQLRCPDGSEPSFPVYVSELEHVYYTYRDNTDQTLTTVVPEDRDSGKVLMCHDDSEFAPDGNYRVLYNNNQTLDIPSNFTFGLTNTAPVFGNGDGDFVLVIPPGGNVTLDEANFPIRDLDNKVESLFITISDIDNVNIAIGGVLQTIEGVSQVTFSGIDYTDHLITVSRVDDSNTDTGFSVAVADGDPETTTVPRSQVAVVFELPVEGNGEPWYKHPAAITAMALTGLSVVGGTGYGGVRLFQRHQRKKEEAKEQLSSEGQRKLGNLLSA